MNTTSTTSPNETAVRNDTATAVSPNETAVRNDTATMICPQCGDTFRPLGRRQWCSDACRQAAWRRRNTTPRAAVVLPARTVKADTVYECPNCQTRYLGQQHCPDCRTFCRNIGRGAPCPHCDEFVTVGDLTGEQGARR